MFIKSFRRHSTIKEFHMMVLGKTYRTYTLASSKSTRAISRQRTIPLPKLCRIYQILECIPQDENRQQPTQNRLARHEIQSQTLLRWRVFYLPRVELGHIPCRHMVKEYQGFLCTVISSRATPQVFSLGASFCSHRIIQ